MLNKIILLLLCVASTSFASTQIINFDTTITQQCGFTLVADNGVFGIDGDVTGTPVTITAFNNESTDNKSNIGIGAYTPSDGLADGISRTSSTAGEVIIFAFDGPAGADIASATLAVMQAGGVTVTNGLNLNIHAATTFLAGDSSCLSKACKESVIPST